MAIELIIAVFAVVGMARIASADDQSPWVWGSVTVAIIVLSTMFLHWQFIRIIIAFAVAFGLMFAYKVAADR